VRVVAGPEGFALVWASNLGLKGTIEQLQGLLDGAELGKWPPPRVYMLALEATPKEDLQVFVDALGEGRLPGFRGGIAARLDLAERVCAAAELVIPSAVTAEQIRSAPKHLISLALADLMDAVHAWRETCPR
jgi:hypothetical protein